ncbi:uncharacterized protein BDV17DRAFT_256286 [Aspergillus undulatus]|uniref:uncharacterized protein n=1 Tax=Aspergillus undulatus TaxID=1810928 RepID=UPI003CCE052C
MVMGIYSGAVVSRAREVCWDLSGPGCPWIIYSCWVQVRSSCSGNRRSCGERSGRRVGMISPLLDSRGRIIWPRLARERKAIILLLLLLLATSTSIIPIPSMPKLIRAPDITLSMIIPLFISLRILLIILRRNIPAMSEEPDAINIHPIWVLVDREAARSTGLVTLVNGRRKTID